MKRLEQWEIVKDRPFRRRESMKYERGYEASLVGRSSACCMHKLVV